MNGELPGLLTDLLALDLVDILGDSWRAALCFDRGITIYEARHRNAYVLHVCPCVVRVRQPGYLDAVDAAKEHHGRKVRDNLDVGLGRCV